MLVINKIVIEKIADTIKFVIAITLAGFFSLAIMGFFLNPEKDNISAVVICFAIVVICVVSCIRCSQHKKLRRGAVQIAEYMAQRKSCSLRELTCLLERDEETVRKTLLKVLQRGYLCNVSYIEDSGLLVGMSVASNAVKKHRCTTCGALVMDAAAQCVHCGTRIRF